MAWCTQVGRFHTKCFLLSFPKSSTFSVPQTDLTYEVSGHEGFLQGLPSDKKSLVTNCYSEILISGLGWVRLETLAFVGGHVFPHKTQKLVLIDPAFVVPRFESCDWLRIFPRIIRGHFVLRFVGDGDQKNFTKSPRHFSMQNSQANTKKIFTKFFWRAGKVTIRNRQVSAVRTRLSKPPFSNLPFRKLPFSKLPFGKLH